MLKSHDKFHSADGKRRILVAEDELINREILAEIFKEDYEVLFAVDGGQTLEMMREYKDTLSLVLLDILMPVMSGLDVLRIVREDEELERIPIIVTTAEKETEIESLELGAIDFIPKPYPLVGVILARVRRTIELSEDRDIIQSTERDELTGLYNREYFYRYAEQFDQHHKEMPMDALVVDVDHFRMLNERYGRQYGDGVLRRIGEQLRNIVRDSGGIVCRREADTFMVYCPHREDYPEIMESAQVDLKEGEGTENRVRLRLGIYSDVDKSIDIERRFDRAKMAADTVKGTFTRKIGTYDNDLHKKELFAEQLIEEFPTAIAENHFQVYYQPKFDVRPETPVLTSAEALVRWIHPDQGMISPGVFIPLFEENGLIRQLDHYVWRETARQIRSWKDKYNYSVPVSVNVSRIDMYDPKLPDILAEILKEFDLTERDLLLEVTESAYTEDARQIVETVEGLRAMGFQIEMDDFGTGYSSLNMISDLPIDALKLDMQFIRNAFREGGTTHMLEVIIGISDFLSVPVIAEGVETEEQLDALKSLGCDIVQGYFFSKPVSASEFEPFILQKKELEKAEARRASLQRETAYLPLSDVGKAERTGFRVRREDRESAAGTAPDTAEKLPDEDAKVSGIKLRTVSIIFVILSLFAAVALLISDLSVTSGYQRMENASDRFSEAQLAASDMMTGSDYLTDRVRCFVVTGDLEYLKDFIEEVEVTRRRDRAVENMEKLLTDEERKTALGSLNTALDLSNELVEIENYAIRLTVEAGDYDMAEVPEEILSIPLLKEDEGLSPAELKDKAQELVFDNNYRMYKERILENVSRCSEDLIRSSENGLEQASARLSRMVRLQTAMTIVFLLIVLVIVAIITILIRVPLTKMVSKMQEQEIIPPAGVEELQFVTKTYNRFLKENLEARERLSHEASHDALTGLLNRGAYDLLMENSDMDHMALILIDVDYFKSVNDTYGHDAGDRVLKRVAEILRHSFRSVDIICRIGGDEFVVVMTRANSSMKQLVLNKISRANDLLQNPKDDLPPVSLSVGVAFSDRRNPQGDLFKDADTALYRAKEAGRKGCCIFE